MIGVIVGDGARGFPRAHLPQTCVLINARQVRAANRLVLIQEQTRTEYAAVLIQFLRFLQIFHRPVDLVGLLVEQGRVEPGRRILRIERPRQSQFLDRIGLVA
jgi:hypothetical protein